MNTPQIMFNKLDATKTKWFERKIEDTEFGTEAFQFGIQPTREKSSATALGLRGMQWLSDIRQISRDDQRLLKIIPISS